MCLTSTRSQSFIAARGGKHLRFKKGYKNVIDKAIELNNQVCIFIPLMGKKF